MYDPVYYTIPPPVEYVAYDDPNAINTLFVSGLPDDVKAREIHNLFRRLPGFDYCQLKYTGRGNQVVAFATFVNHPSALAALHSLNGVKFDPQTGSTLHIELARSNSRRKNKPGAEAYVVIDKRSTATKDNHEYSDDGDSETEEPAEPNKDASTKSDEETAGDPENTGAAENEHTENTVDGACSTLFLANLGPNCTESELKPVLSRYPGFNTLKVRNRGGMPVAFADYDEVEQATEVMNALQGSTLPSSDRGGIYAYRKLFSLSRQTCVVKLPLVFSAFTGFGVTDILLASDHEEPLSVPVSAFKSVIHTCIDESLIKEGLDQTRPGGGRVTESDPTVIEKLCAIVESLLDYRFVAVWDMSFQVTAAMFDKLGEFSSYFLKGALKSLERIQKLPDEAFMYRKQILEAQDPFDVNVWLFPILMQNIVGARLSFFRKSILESIRLLKLRSAKHNQEGRIHSATCVDGLVCSLWSLLPSFCNYPVDTAESFKDLEAELCGSLHEEADFHGVICSGLQILIQKNKIIKARENEVFFYTSEVAARNLDVLRSSASEILHILSGIFMKSTKDDGGYLLATICEFASIADKSVVSGLFKIFMEKLLEVKTEADKIHNTNVSCSMEIDNSSNESSLSLMWEKLYDLAVTLLPGLGTKEVDLLFDEVKLALKIQKKAYKLLSTILEHDDSFIARRFEELLKLMYSFFSQASQA